MSENSEDPKIIVDEDWKEKVRAEREAARATRQAESDEPSGSQPPAGEPDAFSILISSLATQAMMALGQVADPSQGHAVVRPELAKHSIDTLTMLEEKTKGNLSPAETSMLSDVLHQLRMLYVAVYKEPGETAAGDANASDNDNSAANPDEAPPSEA